MGRVRSYIGLGSNVGDPDRSLTEAVHALAALHGARLRGVSRLYLTRPVGVVDQPEFHNAVVSLELPAGPDPTGDAQLLLADLKRLERLGGRQARRRWGPREIDLDLLIFGRHRIRTERDAAGRSADPARSGDQWLEVPHPWAQDRLFVLAPLADLAPGLRPPGWGGSVRSAMNRQLEVEGADAVSPIGRWDPSRGTWASEGREHID